MVDTHLRRRGIDDPRVLDAMSRVPRHRFVRHGDTEFAYGDYPVDIGLGQTISQPYIVAFMTQALALPPTARVLEIGTGSAYQTAILAEVAALVFSIEIVPEHAAGATLVLDQLHYTNVHVRSGDGYGGWPEAAAHRPSSDFFKRRARRWMDGYTVFSAKAQALLMPLTRPGAQSDR